MTRELVLVVEPEPGTGAHVTNMLRDSGYRTGLVHDALKAIEFLMLHPECRLVLSNIHLPGISGLMLLDRIRESNPNAAVLLCADPRHAAPVVQAFHHGVTDVLLKPLQPKTLSHALRNALQTLTDRRENVLRMDRLESLVSERSGQLRDVLAHLERSYDVTIEAMGDALDLRDEETEGHSKRVTAYTIALARQIGLCAAELKTIARGAFLHDVGKIAIPDAILLKPGKLTPEEMTIMRHHCERGYAIVRKIPFLADAAEIVYSHQERFDGNGYPRGLCGHEITLGARIFAIADALDAITSDRPYRRASSFAHAIEEISSCRGTQFDPDIVDTFLSMPQTTWTAIHTEIGRHSPTIELMRAAAA